MSSHRDDGIFNPVRIPDITVDTPKISRGADSHLEKFIHGLIVEEFDGPEPTKLTLRALAAYVRHLSPTACQLPLNSAPSLEGHLKQVSSAVEAAIIALDLGDSEAARLMVTSARSSLGLIDERFADPALWAERSALRVADAELRAAGKAIDDRPGSVRMRLVAWTTKLDVLAVVLEYGSTRSLYRVEVLERYLGSAGPDN
jgi:hypothetical protein